MTAFTLDTSGRVAGNFEGLAVWYEFEDLDPFTQGYVEALCAEATAKGVRGYLSPIRGNPVAFRDLAPETVARIMEDCARFQKTRNASAKPGDSYGSDAWGRWLWEQRNAGRIEAFPPLTTYVGDDGLIYLSAPDRALEASPTTSAGGTQNG